MNCESVTIPVKEYEVLRNRAFLLECLRNGGVDNWDGYDDAIDKYQQLREGEE